MKPLFIYFDLDNTLLDHSAAEARAQQETHMAHSELIGVSLETWLATYRSVNHDLWELYQKGKVNRHQLQQLRFKDSMWQLGLDTSRSEEIGFFYMRSYRKHWDWIDGAREAFTVISSNYKSGIITNGFRETQQKKLDQLAIGKQSRVTIITEDIGVLKPHPRVFDVATERAAVRREQILYVGDSYSSDIIGARNAGWQTAWYTGFENGISEDQTADFVFSGFRLLQDYLSDNTSG